MHISKFQLVNYKSYLSSDELELAPGINIVVGPNNAGKTALLEGLSLRFIRKPYGRIGQSNATVPGEPDPSIAHVSLTISRAELLTALRDMSDGFCVPLPDKETLYELNNNEMLAPGEHTKRFVNDLLSAEYYTVRVGARAADHNEAQLFATHFPAIGQYEAGGYTNKRSFAICSINDDGMAVLKHVQEENSQDGLDFGLQIVHRLRARIYSFRAERIIAATYPAGLYGDLRPDARNLADVLSRLQGHPAKFREFNHYLRYVLPHVFEVATRDVEARPNQMGMQREIIIFEADESDAHAAIPLGDSGTGVGQVLAMLYVLVNSEQPQTFIIDEPQSFLHQGAVRKLFEVVKNFPQHQYIVSTHAPSVIAVAGTATVIRITKQRRQASRLTLIDPCDTEQLRLTLHEVGARLSDVFGADYILWVEGATERDCFPLILEKLSPRRLMGTEFVPVLSSDKTLGREADKVIEIYQRLTEGRGLLPPATGFIFDRNCRPTAKIADLERLANRRVKFIKRRMYENYLLNPNAIEAVLLEIGIGENQVSVEAIQHWLAEEIKQAKYYCAKSKEKSPWVEHIDGAKLLENLFSHFSGGTLFYDAKKVEYGVRLTRWLLNNDAQHLEEIAALIQTLLPSESPE